MLSSTSISTSLSPGPPAGAQGVTARRVRFAAERGQGTGKVVRRFSQPRAMLAVEDELSVAQLSERAVAATGWADRLDLVVSPRDISVESHRLLESWMGSPDAESASVVMELEGVRIAWRPGKAWVQGAANRCEEFLPGLIDFAFYEGELRRLEELLPPYEAAAAGDAKLAFRVGKARRDDWRRLEKSTVELREMRLVYARLEPQLYLPVKNLAADARRMVSQLRDRTEAEDRLEALNDRMEACEELYEGAVDRVTDYRWFEKEMILEVGIVILLAIEAGLLAWQIFGR